MTTPEATSHERDVLYSASCATDGFLLKMQIPDEAGIQNFVCDFWTVAGSYGFRENDPVSRRFIKVRILNMGSDVRGKVVKIECYGAAAAMFPDLPPWLSTQTASIHVKAYMHGIGPEDFTALRGELMGTTGNQQLTLFDEKRRASANKGTGEGFRIGDRDSDFHLVAYKRTGERASIECRVGGAAMRRLVRETVTQYGPSDGMQKFISNGILLSARRYASKRLFKEFDSRGVELAEFCEGFTDSVAEHYTRPVVGRFDTGRFTTATPDDKEGVDF